MTERAQPIMDGELRTMLRDLLSSADADGQINTKDFWLFVSALAVGRGVTKRLDAEGMAAATEAQEIVPRAGEKEGDIADRARRAYILTVLRQLLVDMDAQGGPSLLPSRFPAGAVAGDISMMLGGPYGMGIGRPQILESHWKGDNYLQQERRKRFVGAVYFEAARRGQKDPKQLLSEFGANTLNASTWKTWVEDADKEGIPSQAEADGAAENLASKWHLSGEHRAKLWGLIDPTPKKLKKAKK